MKNPAAGNVRTDYVHFAVDHPQSHRGTDRGRLRRERARCIAGRAKHPGHGQCLEQAGTRSRPVLRMKRGYKTTKGKIK